jgi:hypothetical protein
MAGFIPASRVFPARMLPRLHREAARRSRCAQLPDMTAERELHDAAPSSHVLHAFRDITQSRALRDFRTSGKYPNRSACDGSAEQPLSLASKFHQFARGEKSCTRAMRSVPLQIECKWLDRLENNHDAKRERFLLSAY